MRFSSPLTTLVFSPRKVDNTNAIEPLVISSAIVTEQAQSLFLADEEAVDAVGSIVHPGRVPAPARYCRQAC
jgi:hypothetical protein